MSDSIFNRLRRQIEPRPTDERGRDFEDQSHAPDHGATERRDPGADAMSELARLISDPLAPIPARPSDGPGGRLAARDPLGRLPAREPVQSQDRPYEGRS